MSESLIRSMIPKMAGWLSVERALEMYQLILDYKPRVAVEIGVFGGRSLVVSGLAMKENGFGRIYGIDPWRNQDCLDGEHDHRDSSWWAKVDLHTIHRQCMESIWRLGLDPYVTVIRAASQNCHEIIPQDIGVLYIDGNHSELASCRDVELYLPKVQSGGYVWMDDCDWLTTSKAQSIMDVRCRLIRDARTHRLYQKP